jgi:hypothetical protein
MFGWVIVSRQLHHHIYYLFVAQGPYTNKIHGKAKWSGKLGTLLREDYTSFLLKIRLLISTAFPMTTKPLILFSIHNILKCVVHS